MPAKNEEDVEEEIEAALGEERQEKIRERTGDLVMSLFEQADSVFAVEEGLRQRLSDVEGALRRPNNLEAEIKKYNHFIKGLEAATSLKLHHFKLDEMGINLDYIDAVIAEVLLMKKVLKEKRHEIDYGEAVDEIDEED